MFVGGMIVGFIIFMLGIIIGDAVATYHHDQEDFS